MLVILRHQFVLGINTVSAQFVCRSHRGFPFQGAIGNAETVDTVVAGTVDNGRDDGAVAVLGDFEKIHESAGSFASIRTGTVLATVLIVSAACIIWAQQKVLSKGHYQIIGGKSFRPMELKLRGLRYPLLFFCLAYIGFTILLPTMVIFMVGGVETYGLPLTWENLSLDNYKYILFEYDVTRDAIFNSELWVWLPPSSPCLPAL